jgi:hypothetical protein
MHTETTLRLYFDGTNQKGERVILEAPQQPSRLPIPFNYIDYKLMFSVESEK